MSDTSSRLSADDWLFAGFRALAANGPKALKAEPLARVLSTTKGSFYWHFRDVADFKARMLGLWEEAASAEIVARLDAIPDAAARFHALAEVATSDNARHGGRDAEPAIRAWGREDPDVAAAIRRVDQRRLAYVAGLCDALSLPPYAARLFYAAYVGLETLTPDPDHPDGNTLTCLLDSLGVPPPA